MEVVELKQGEAFPLGETVLTIGNYDGLHIGHREIMKKLVFEANQLGLPSVVVSFEPHPMKILQPSKGFQSLYGKDDLVEQLERCGVDHLVLELFTPELAKLTAREFFEKEIYSRFKPKVIVVGYDFTFGANRSGDKEFLNSISEEFNFELVVCDSFKWNSEIVSSSKIRSSLKCGKLEEANCMLDRVYSLEGVVEKGEGRGKSIGVPTANMKIDQDLILGSGVYCTKSQVKNREVVSVTNIGTKPTFHKNNQAISIETHFIGESLEVLDKSIKVKFYKKIRDERKFESVGELVDQIKRDIQATKDFFNG